MKKLILTVTVLFSVNSFAAQSFSCNALNTSLSFCESGAQSQAKDCALQECYQSGLENCRVVYVNSWKINGFTYQCAAEATVHGQ